jgi:two-component system, chemotaxis family, chemotaxis protein CheY
MKRCLIVDDSNVIRKVARGILEDLGYDISEAENGKEALAICKSNPPDVIFLDWQLPVMGALEFLRGLRLHLSGKRPHIIYCTTENDFSDLSRAYAAGADDFMMKPFDRQMMLEKFAPTSMAL